MQRSQRCIDFEIEASTRRSEFVHCVDGNRPKVFGGREGLRGPPNLNELAPRLRDFDKRHLQRLQKLQPKLNELKIIGDGLFISALETFADLSGDVLQDLQIVDANSIFRRESDNLSDGKLRHNDIC